MLSVTAKVELLDEIFSPVDALADSCEIRFTRDYLRIPAADRMSIAIADIEVPKESFRVYDSDSRKIGVQLERLTKALNAASSDDLAQIRLEGDDFLRIRVKNKKFVLGQVSLDSVPNQPPLGTLEHSLVFHTDKSILRDAIRTAGFFSDKVTFDSEDDQVSLKARGDIDRTSVTLTGADVEIEEPDNVTNSFDQQYLLDIISKIPNETELTIKMSNSTPMELQYPIAGGEGTVEYTLAPWKGSR